jgi:hypothetical protein
MTTPVTRRGEPGMQGSARLDLSGDPGVQYGPSVCAGVRPAVQAMRATAGASISGSADADAEAGMDVTSLVGAAVLSMAAAGVHPATSMVRISVVPNPLTITFSSDHGPLR